MGYNATINPILLVVGLCIAATVLLAVIGFVLRGRGKLRTQRASLIWALLTIAPLFGAGFGMFAKHEVERAVGITKSGENAPEVRSAP